MVKEGKITKKEHEKLLEDIVYGRNLRILTKYLDFEVLQKHYYSPILFKQDSNHFQHIIKTQSEIDFLQKLRVYSLRDGNKLKTFEWWYFSKIDEAIDKIGIPYFDEEKGEYRTFFPDFIFWLKRKSKYYLVFIDPKGVEFTTNSANKIDGFNIFLEAYERLKDKKLERIKLVYFNDQQPGTNVKEEYRKHWEDDFNKIFALSS